ncbi:MAG: thioredoxin domain-containing protein [Pseudomonadota bacterium]|nr:thioredoxin domain-containing protein [Pseudomonadota bacterium]
MSLVLALLACIQTPLAVSHPAPASSPAAYGPARPAPAQASDAVLTPVAADIAVDPGTPALGPADAAVVVVTYSDFACPYCAHFFPLLVALSGRRPDIRFVFGSFPLDSDCNAIISRPMHRYACEASVAASCADDQGKYVQLAALLYEYPEHITPPELPAFADRAGLDRAAFDACFAAPDARAALTAHVDRAIALGVDATPTVFARGLSGQPGWVQVSGEAGAMLAAVEAAPRR